MKLCNVITSHEAGTAGDRIQQILSLPTSATRLDASISAASNVEELLVASSSFSQGDFPKRRESQHGSPIQYNDRKSRSPFKRQQYDSWKKGRNNSYHSPNGSRWVKKPSSPSPWRSSGNSGRGKVENVRSASQHRDHTPKRREYQSPGGRWWRELSKSPGHRNRSGSRQQRGRSVTPKGRKRCLRCGDPLHSGENCPKFPYYNGRPCNICGLLHETKAHKDRSSSARRNPSHREAQSHQIEVGVTPTDDIYKPRPNVFKNSGYENIFGEKN